MDPNQVSSINNAMFLKSLHPKQSPLRFVLALLVLLMTVAVIVYSLVYFLSDSQQNTTSVGAINEEIGLVKLTSEGFSPSTISVRSGQQVTFRNDDTTGHRVYADPEYLFEFDSVETLGSGSSYTYVFDTPGVYRIYDPADNIKYHSTVEVQ